MRYRFVGYGHVLDDYIMKKLWDQFRSEFIEDEYDIRQIKISLPSSLASRGKGGLSRLSFTIISGDDNKAERRVNGIRNFLENQDMRIAYCEPDNELSVHRFYLTGHVIEEKLMDGIAKILSPIGVDAEEVVISYPSVFFSKDREIPSLASFFLTGSEDQIRKASNALRSFCAKDSTKSVEFPLKKASLVEIPKRDPFKYFIRIWGHVLDSELLDDLAAFVEDGVADILDVSITYPSSMVCRHKREPSLMSFILVSSEKKDITKKIRKICQDNGLRMLVAIPIDRYASFKFKIVGDIIEKNILNRLSDLMFGEITTSLKVDLKDIVITYDSVSKCADLQAPSELYCVTEYEDNGCSKVLSHALESIKQEFNCQITTIPFVDWRKNGNFSS